MEKPIYGFEVYLQCPDDMWEAELRDDSTSLINVSCITNPDIGDVWIQVHATDKSELNPMFLMMISKTLEDVEFRDALIRVAQVLRLYESFEEE